MKVALLMGSDSDLKRLEPCLAVLAKLEIPCLARVLSAHRTPEALASFVQEEAPAQSVRVFICAAGFMMMAVSTVFFSKRAAT